MTTNGAALDGAEGLIKLWQAQPVTGATSDMVYAVLHEAILSGVLLPGQRLAEESFAALFNVSRTPVREAFVRLETTGLAHRVPRRGLIVGKITPQEIVDVYVVRETMDGLAAYLAAQFATPGDVAHLASINAEFALAAERGDAKEMARLNLEFHTAIAASARNSLLVQFLENIHHLVRRFPGTTFQHPGRAAEAIEEHEQLIAAIRSGDADDARRIASESMAKAREIRIAMLARDAASLVPA
jgi:DNA-binding GntR family transcriptional regulator